MSKYTIQGITIDLADIYFFSNKQNKNKSEIYQDKSPLNLLDFTFTSEQNIILKKNKRECKQIIA